MTRIAAAFIALLVSSAAAGAADLQVLSSLALTTTLEKAVPAFEQATGHAVNVTFSTASGIRRQMEAGGTADLLLISGGAVAALAAQGTVVADSATSLASTGTGVAVRAGAPRPDIATPEALKQALLDAPSVAYTAPARGGASGVHFAAVLERLGITEAVNAKAVLVTTGRVGDVVARGEAELGVHTITELLPVDGIDVVGPLPPELQNTFLLAAAVPATSAEPEAARAFIAFLKTPAMRKVMEDSGLTPLP